MRSMLLRPPRASPRVLPTFLSVLALVAAGCGDDTDEGTPDPPPDCLVSVELSGGYQASLSPDDPYACGIPFGGDSGVWMYFLPLEGDLGVLDISIDDVTEGETGTFPADATITLRDERRWTTAPGDCTVQVDEHSFQKDDGNTKEYLMTGSGSCSAPAEAFDPATGDPATDEPITIGPFEFRFPPRWFR